MLDRQHGLAAEWVIGLSMVSGLLGCASPAVPKPPTLRLPELAKNVTAERVGGKVTVRWTTPSETTDHLKVKGPVVAVICQEQPSRRRGPGACTPVDKKIVAAGEPAEAVETLPAELTVGASHSLSYRVELQNDRGRSVGKSDAGWTASGAAPGAVEGLTIVSRREGALVRWRAVPDSGWVEVKRLRLDPPEKPKAGTAQAMTAKPGGQPVEVPVVLRAGGDGSSAQSAEKASDMGGMMDTSVQRAAHYRYTAQRVQTIMVGGHEVIVRGVESAAVNFTPRDTFAPAAPAGLVAVPGSGSIDLSWEAGDEPDLAGYNVYRRSGDGAETKLTAEPVAGPAFRDMTAVTGAAYSYRVTAVDANGNESERSGEIRETAR